MAKMETACLRIKFTPLLQNIQKEDSRHCLEIVPEITCIQNLDKIQWTKEENSIEYTIPMTYKVILRKKHVIKEEVLDKTYHSCVDLLLPSSDSNFMGLGSGDISRIVSDTFVLSKVTTDVENCSILLKEADNEKKNHESTEIMTAQVQTEAKGGLFFTDQLINNEEMRAKNYKSRNTAITQTFPEVVQSECNVVQVRSAHIADYIKKSIDKITNTEASSGTEVKTKSLEEADQISINSKTETKRNLSLTPICSITTEDNNETTNRIASNTILYLRYETQKFGNAGIGGSIQSDDLFLSVYKRNYNTNICNEPKQYNSVSNHRVLPEIRVANFIKIMEKEIMPLKLMLSDILTKCSYLGFNWKKSQQSPIMYKNIPNREKLINRCMKTKKQTDSNRVVYSIVFDG